MIIPCIDLQGGKAVQLVRGRKLALSVDDVLGLLERFRDYPILHVIDLDAAIGTGSNGRWIKILSRRARMKIRVGGGIRSVARAEKILSWGAEKIIVGSAAFRDGKIAHDFLQAHIGPGMSGEKGSQKVGGKQRPALDHVGLDIIAGGGVGRDSSGDRGRRQFGRRQIAAIKKKQPRENQQPQCQTRSARFADNL